MKNIYIPTKVAIAIMLIFATASIWFLCVENMRNPYALEILAADYPQIPILNYLVELSQNKPDAQDANPFNGDMDPICLADNLENIPFEMKKITYIAKSGDNLWAVLTFSLKQQELIRPLDSNESIKVLDNIKDAMKKMSPEELKAIGISSGDATKLSPGDTVNLSPIILDVKKIYDSTGIDLLKLKFSESYKKNDTYVCWNAIRLRGADPKTFTAFSDFAGMDKNAVYFINVPFSSPDLDSFTFLSANYSKDARSAYYFRKQIEGADARSFQVLDNGYAIDKNYVYLSDERLEGANPNDKMNFIGIYLRSGNSIYRGKELIVGANADKFTPYVNESGLATDYSKDDQHVFYKQYVIPDADMDSFQIIGDATYSKDKNNVYCRNKIIKDADISTFHITPNRMTVEDKNYTYSDCIPLPKQR